MSVEPKESTDTQRRNLTSVTSCSSDNVTTCLVATLNIMPFLPVIRKGDRSEVGS